MMLYRRFGKTEINMPVFTCGGMRFQFSWARSDTPTKENRENVKRTISRALELGINHIETAHGYGTSEEEIGSCIKDIPRDTFILQTKATPKKNANEFLSTFQESMKALQVKYLDLFTIHGINNEVLLRYTLRKGGCLDTALKLKEDGLIRHIGFSSHGPTHIIVEAVKSDCFDYANLHWYYIFQDNRPAIVEANQRDMGILIISPNDKGGMLYDPPEKLKSLTSPLSPMIFNDIFCLSREEVITLAIGAARPEDYDEHVKALKFLDQCHELLPPIEERLKEAYHNVLGKEWAETWRDGLPQWHKTPGYINIPVILFLWNLAKAYDMVEYGKKRYNLMGFADHWFPGNKPASLKNSDFSKCLENSPHAQRIPAILNEAHALLSGKEVKRLGTH